MKTKPKICIVGSSNIDMNSYVPRFPRVGETLHGHHFTTGYGGKGANQAVTAARLGGAVAFVGKVGSDLFGRDMLKNFAAEGINAAYVAMTEVASSGVAVITIDETGANTIVVTAGANGLLTAAEVEGAGAVIEQAQVLVCQMEVPLEANLAALRIARAAGVPTVFNPAPAVADLPEEIYRLSDVFCPNETETAILTGASGEDVSAVTEAARLLIGRGAGQVVVTLGERGSLLVTADAAQLVAATAVKAVDTTGAGDAFVGTLAYCLAAGLPLVEGMSRANRVAAISVQRPGAQSSFPRAEELPAGLLP